MELQDRSFAMLEVRSVDEAKRTFIGIANSGRQDSHGTWIEPDGAEYTLPIPLFYHDRGEHAYLPFGNVIRTWVEKGKRWVEAHIPPIPDDGTPGGRSVRDRLDAQWTEVKSGLVRGLSIDFIPIDPPRATRGTRVKKWSWRGLTVVPIPSNMDASILSVRSLLAASGDSASQNPGVTGAPTPSHPRPRTMKTYSERITALENKRAANLARMDAISQKAEDDGRTKDASEQEEFDTLHTEVAAVDRELVDVRALEKLNTAKAVAVNAGTSAAASESRGGVATVRVRAHEEPGIPMARLVRAIGVAHRKHRDVESVARELYPDDQLVQRAAVAAHNTTTDAALVSSEGGVFADFVEYLRPQTIVGKFGTNGIPSLRNVPFRTPLITQTGKGAGYWVGEGAAKPVTKFTWSRTHIDPLKVANIAVITDELLRSSSPAADRLIRDSLVEALRERMDTDFIDPAKAASAGVSPASITNAATPIPSSEATASTYVDNDAVSVDVQAAMGGFIAADNAPTSGVWIMSPTRALALSLMRNALGQRENDGLTMNGGTFAGLPVIVSRYVAATTIVLVNAEDVYLADEGGFQVDSSTEASLQMDGAPTNNSVTPTATTLVSMFQTNSVAIRAERIINWALRRASAVQVITDAYWGDTTPA
jgi:HK97 family phage major capsid protein